MGMGQSYSGTTQIEMSIFGINHPFLRVPNIDPYGKIILTRSKLGLNAWWLMWVTQRIAFRKGHENPNSVCQVWNSHGCHPTASGLWFQLQAVWLSFVSPGAQKDIFVSEHGGIPNGKLWYTNVFFFFNYCYTLWTWGDTMGGYLGGIPWGYHIFRKKNRSWPSKLELPNDALFGWPNGECFTTSRNKNTLEPQIWYRRWYPRGFATNVGENMDDINRDIYEILSGIFWDTGW